MDRPHCAVFIAASLDGRTALVAVGMNGEPLPPDHPLYSLPNCLVLPHIGSATRSSRDGMAVLASAWPVDRLS